jgi:transcriptional regulator with XRE-family HTH domain
MSVNGPTIVRRQLGRRLRQSRKRAGKTIDGVVTSGVVSKATLHRYESGRVPITPGTVLELSLLYDLDQPTTRALYDLAIGSQQRGWWEDNDPAAEFGLGFYTGLESAASLIESYQPEVLFGLLQTPDYARAVEQADAFAPDADLVARRVAHRLRRKEIFERTPPVSVRVVLGAGVLTRQVGGPQVMADQIAHLRDEVRGDRVEVRCCPGKAVPTPRCTGPSPCCATRTPTTPPSSRCRRRSAAPTTNCRIRWPATARSSRPCTVKASP